MKHLDLFSGIGGFALAASWVWPDHEVVAFCDNEPFCQKVLSKHWPDVPVIDDIRKIKGEDYGAVDIITGGFPCQPFSCAGKRGGEADDRYLWPEMLRIIREIRPTWVIGENVAGIINMALDQVCTDLEDAGYTVQAFIIPACAVDAPHRRDRVWIVGHSAGARREACNAITCGTKPESGELADSNRDASDPQGISGWPGLCENGQEQDGDQLANGGGDATNSGRIGRHNAWDEPWLEAATRLCGIHDGVSGGVHRTDRLKSLGNAIVPQVAAVIMQAIRELDDRFCKKTNVKDC
jgi:DNA (cytosine-5)-methyltransferase 1